MNTQQDEQNRLAAMSAAGITGTLSQGGTRDRTVMQARPLIVRESSHSHVILKVISAAAPLVGRAERGRERFSPVALPISAGFAGGRNIPLLLRTVPALSRQVRT